MHKKRLALLLTLGLLLSLTACGAAAPAVNDLTTQSQQDQVRTVMEAAKLSGVDVFFDWVNEYHAAAGTPLESDTNCRLTAFLLLQDSMEATPSTDYGTFLMMDVDALENQPRYQSLREKSGKFIALFNQVSVAEAQKDTDYLAAFPAAWAQRGVVFPSGNVSLVSVVMSDSLDKVLFIGHTGVLIEAEKALWFIEKLAPDQPYQVTQYASRSDLAAALLDRDAYTLGDADFPPFVLENDQLLLK